MAITVSLPKSKFRRRGFRSALLIVANLLASGSAVASHATDNPEQPLPGRFMERLYSPSTFVVFDWDDNVLKMPTRLILFPRGIARAHPDENVFYVSSPELANFKNEVGIPGTPLEKFEVITDVADPIHGSFRFTMPGLDGRNYMLEDVKSAVTREGLLLDRVPDAVKAPFFELFMTRESNEATRRASRILTGRGQTPVEFHEAVSFLAQVPEIRTTGFEAPLEERVTLVGGRGHAWHMKAVDLVSRMREAAKLGYKLFAFSDDDPMNIRRAAEVLAETPRSIDVWLIWTREHGDSRLIDLSEINIENGITIETILDRALNVKKNQHDAEIENSKHETERAALMCRAVFF